MQGSGLDYRGSGILGEVCRCSWFFRAAGLGKEFLFLLSRLPARHVFNAGRFWNEG